MKTNENENEIKTKHAQVEALNAETEPASTTTIGREFHNSMTREKKENLQVN